MIYSSSNGQTFQRVFIFQSIDDNSIVCVSDTFEAGFDKFIEIHGNDCVYYYYQPDDTFYPLNVLVKVLRSEGIEITYRNFDEYVDDYYCIQHLVLS